jgi:hypothetical protein
MLRRKLRSGSKGARMGKLFRLSPILVLSLLLLPLQVTGQDTPSLGDAARQARLQKQQKEAQVKDAPNKGSKDPEGKDSPSKSQPILPKRITRIITNKELPEHSAPAAQPVVASEASHDSIEGQPSSAATQGKAEGLKSQIVSMESNIASLQTQIESLSGSIHFAPANCVENCAQWNERQLQKQQQLDQMKAQLEDQQKQLEDLQESARQQGFGSSVYEP